MMHPVISAMARLAAPVAAAIAAALSLSAPAAAQTRAQLAASQAADLALPQEAKRLADYSGVGMALIRPDAPPPWPALVLLHQCAGLNPAIAQHAREAVRRSYLVLVLDSFSQRGVGSVCYGPRQGVNFMRGVRDALLAAEHLRKRDDVDPGRLVFAGFSWGAMVGAMGASREYRTALGFSRGFDRIAGFYPGCFDIKPPGGEPYPIVRAGIDTPLLVLAGGLDTETPARECSDRLAAQRALGAPVQFELYPEATHCWGCRHIDGHSRIDVRGNHVAYRYDEAITRRSLDRAFAFFAAAKETKANGTAPPANSDSKKDSPASPPAIPSVPLR